jgi:hypothetical protein
MLQFDSDRCGICQHIHPEINMPDACLVIHPVDRIAISTLDGSHILPEACPESLFDLRDLLL